jgi:hypothetical protein
MFLAYDTFHNHCLPSVGEHHYDMNCNLFWYAEKLNLNDIFYKEQFDVDQQGEN